MHWVRSFVFVSTGKEKLQIPITLKRKKIKFDIGRSPEDLDSKQKEITKINKTANCVADPPTLEQLLKYLRHENDSRDNFSYA